MKNLKRYIPAFVIAAFGLLTLFLSGSVIFDLFGIRAKEGNYVLFIVWANFISSIIYLIAAYGFYTQSKWTVKILAASVGILLVAYIAFGIYINGGGIHETKTVYAMAFRTTVTVVFMAIAYFTINKKQIS